MKNDNKRSYDVVCNLKTILDGRKDITSIRQLAEKADLPFETVRRLYNDNTKRYQRETLAAICVTLNIDISDLLSLQPIEGESADEK